MLSFKKVPENQSQVHGFIAKSGVSVIMPNDIPTPKKGYKVVYLLTITTAKGIHTYAGSTTNLRSRLSFHLSAATWSRLARLPLYNHFRLSFTPICQIQVVAHLPIKAAANMECDLIRTLQTQTKTECLNVRIGGFKGKPEVRKKKITGYKTTHNKPFIALNTKTGGKTQWTSTTLAAAGLGLNQGNISNALKGNFKKVKHYKFFYLKTK